MDQFKTRSLKISGGGKMMIGVLFVIGVIAFVLSLAIFSYSDEEKAFWLLFAWSLLLIAMIFLLGPVYLRALGCS